MKQQQYCDTEVGLLGKNGYSGIKFQLLFFVVDHCT